MPSTKISGMNPDFGSKIRGRILQVLVLIFALLFIGRLGYLQILKGSDYRTESEAQALKKKYVEPFRGNMFDTEGNLLVHNLPSFAVQITKNSFNFERLPLLSSILKMDTTEILRRLEKNMYSIFEPTKIARDVRFDIIALLEEYNDMLPGVDVAVESKRLYNFEGNMSHILGYTREISQRQLEERSYYKQGDVIGQNGLERSYEEFLRGKMGVQYIAVNRRGEKIASFDKGKSDLNVTNGFDLILTIDRDLQLEGEKLLEGKQGAIVAIDPDNGEILALVSKPDYDLRYFSGRIPPQIYRDLMNDKGKPFQNRAINSRYPPGSTWKMLVALAGMQEKLITPTSTIYCSGSFEMGRTFKCHGAHGNTNVQHSIQASCNVFYYKLALKLGLEKMAKYANMFGFGEYTNIDIPNESRGLMPDDEYWEKRGGMQKGSLVNYGIGQGEISVTPLQMAVYTSAIASKGTLYQPHLVRAMYNHISDKFEGFSFGRKELPINKSYFDVIFKGMHDVVHKPGGTAFYIYQQRKYKLPDVDIYGKTGTAQNPHGKDHSWFVCFADRKDSEKSRIAISVIVENVGFGSEFAAPIAMDMISKHYGLDTIPKPWVPKPDSLNNENAATANAAQ
jgi:penicillin-binding protein 2